MRINLIITALLYLNFIWFTGAFWQLSFTRINRHNWNASTRTSSKKSIALRQELAPASGVPPALRKQSEPRCIFSQSCKSASACGVPAELQCGALRCIALRNHSVIIEITREASGAGIRCKILGWDVRFFHSRCKPACSYTLTGESKFRQQTRGQ